MHSLQALSHQWFSDPVKVLPYGRPTTLEPTNSMPGEKIFEGLCQYQAAHKLKRAVLQILVRELSDNQVQELRRQFMMLDTSREGRLSVEDIVTGLKSSGCAASTSQLEQVVGAIALGGAEPRHVSYTEFIAALAWRRVGFHERDLLACFRKLDRRGGGRINYRDMCEALRDRSDGEPAMTESEWEDITVPVGSGGLHERLEVTYDRLQLLLES